MFTTSARGKGLSFHASYLVWLCMSIVFDSIDARVPHNVSRFVSDVRHSIHLLGAR